LKRRIWRLAGFLWAAEVFDISFTILLLFFFNPRYWLIIIKHSHTTNKNERENFSKLSISIGGVLKGSLN
jgi:hypothetical protein